VSTQSQIVQCGRRGSTSIRVLVDVVVQIGGDAGANALHFEQPGHSHALDPDGACDRQGDQYSLKPRASPQRRRDAELDRRRRRAGRALRVDGAYGESILSRGDRTVVNRARLGVRAPLSVTESILIAQNVAGRVTQPHVIELDLLLSRLNLDRADARFSRLRNLSRAARNRNARDPHRRWIAGRAILRNQASEPVIGSEPERDERQ
jgi:hypothetical protein